MGKRTAILIRCSRLESAAIHEEAQAERRTVSAYVLHIVLRFVRWDENAMRYSRSMNLNAFSLERNVRGPGPRTSVLLRCANEEACRIRKMARERGMSISGYILRALRLHWKTKRVTSQASQVVRRAAGA